MNFAALKTELGDRGFSRIGDTRLGVLVNEGRRQLDNLYTWPYRLASTSGAAPLTIADLGVIEEVINTDTGDPLSFATRRAILDEWGDVTSTGTPWYFYIDNGIVRTYPVGGTLQVRYYKRTPVLAGTDTPLAPADYHLLIVDLAEREAHGVKSDLASESGLNARIDRKVAQMVEDLFGQQVQGPDGFMALTDGSVDS